MSTVHWIVLEYFRTQIVLYNTVLNTVYCTLYTVQCTHCVYYTMYSRTLLLVRTGVHRNEIYWSYTLV